MATLFDTNIFLEVLLGQEKKKTCKDQLNESIDSLFLSDFSLHSIGVILLKQGKHKVFEAFVEDILSHSTIVSLAKERYNQVAKLSKEYTLDFDDAYQVAIAQEYNLKIATMDRDFKKVAGIIHIDII
ncbi:MAG: PIN domain-containing protein [Bacteroidales bacterium]|nr:PIN domain-containing protein [Bacteroidales bacterium]